jgi:NADH-quinone oxidoreductase subunit L
MLLPVALLALGSTVVGIALLPGLPAIFGANVIGDFLDPLWRTGGGTLISEPDKATGWITLLVGTAASFVGVGLARLWWYLRQPAAAVIAARIPRPLVLLSQNKFYFDELYDAMLVRPSLAVARSMRRLVEPRVMDGWIGGLTGGFRELSLDFRRWQTGVVRDYAMVMLAASMLLVVGMVVVTTR